MMAHCYCEDLLATEEDSERCQCGHWLDQHEDKFFRRCTAEWPPVSDEDEVW